MGWAARVLLFAAIVARSGQAAEPTPDLEKEIAWARAGWRDTLKGLHFHSPLVKLMAWVPRGGTVTAYLYAEDLACRRATLSRGHSSDPTDDREADEPPAPPVLIAKIYDRPRMDSGERVRAITSIEIGVLLTRDDGFTSEVQGPDGRWREDGGGSGCCEPTVYGALSYADDRVARWDGEPLNLVPYCGGPEEWLACRAGGERPCERCEEVDIVAVQPNSLWGHSRHHNRPVTCHDACPPYPESPDMGRVRALSNRTQPWQPRNARLSQVPSLYRSRDDCLRDHPPGR